MREVRLAETKTFDLKSLGLEGTSVGSPRCLDSIRARSHLSTLTTTGKAVTSSRPRAHGNSLHGIGNLPANLKLFQKKKLIKDKKSLPCPR